MAKKPKTVRVLIHARQTVLYSQEVEMELKDFRRISRMVANGDDYEAGQAIEGWIDVTDVTDAFEIEDVELAVVKPLEAPADDT